MGIGNDLAASFQGIQQLVDLAQATNAIGQQSAIYQGQMALNMAQMEAEGLAAQLQLNQIATAANIQTDISSLSMRNMLLLSGKSIETALMMAQYREKTLQLYYAIIDAKSQAVWGRIKQLTQGFKL